MRHVPHFSKPPRRRFGRVRTAFLALIGLMLIWFLGLTWYAKQIPLSLSDGGSKTEAIVVLTGGSERLREGQKLLDQGLAKTLFISGVYRGVEVHQLLEVSKTRPETLACCVELGHSALSTLGNAQETALWAEEKGIRSIRLVTANYHMPRSLVEFSTYMPDVRIIAHPVFPSAFHIREWWRWPGTANLLATEFNKYLVARLRHFLIQKMQHSDATTELSNS